MQFLLRFSFDFANARHWNAFHGMHTEHRTQQVNLYLWLSSEAANYLCSQVLNL